jgi:hypothetical protein
MTLLVRSAGPAPPAPATAVASKDHDSFWLWAGVRPQPALAGARRIYLLQGEIASRPPVQLVAQRQALPRIAHADVWMVVRVETLRWPDGVHDQLLAQLERWRENGNRLVGLQIDFDARTRHLHEYAEFLAGLRRRLPESYRLSVTGLLDWSANGDPAGLDALAGIVDEVVLQIYQGRRVIPGYGAYLGQLDRMKVPFRIGLLQGGEWRPPQDLERNPMFRGYVVFLLNDSADDQKL